MRPTPTCALNPERTTRSSSLWMAMVTCCVLAMLLPMPAHAGKLDSARGEVRGKKASKRSSNESYNSSGDSDASAAAVWVSLYILSSPWWLPHYATGDRFGRTYAFPAHPYAGGIDGYTRIAGQSPPVATQGGHRVLGKNGAISLHGEYGYLGADLSHVTLGARISSVHRVELETEWSNYLENVPGGFDQLWLGDVNLSFVFAQTEHVQFRSGFGVRFMVDNKEGATQVDSGFNFMYGFDWFPGPPFVFSAYGDLGSLGGAFVTDWRATAGLMVGGMQVYVGYKRIDIGEVAFGGPVFGVRSWH